jgi:hypothetical protein
MTASEGFGRVIAELPDTSLIDWGCGAEVEVDVGGSSFADLLMLFPISFSPMFGRSRIVGVQY